MIQSISDSYDFNQSTISSAVSAAQTDETKTDENSVADLSQKTDTVEISEQARAAMQQNAVSAPAGTKASVQEDAGQSADTAALEKTQTKALESESETVNSSTADSTAYNLTTLTQTQLDKLVSQGKITKAQESSELQRRAAEKAQQQSASEQTSLSAGYNAQAGSISGGAAMVGTALDIVA